jgi:hypothetical protein
MDEGVERIKRLSQQAKQAAANAGRMAELEDASRETNRKHLARLETTIPERLRQLVDAADGDLAVESAAFRSQTSTAMQIVWRPGTGQGHAVELWLLRDTGSVEWRWTMGHREPHIVQRVPASRFDLARLDDLVAALAEPERWLGGNPPEV